MNTPVAAATDALPVGFRVELDPYARPLSSGGWWGGQPRRVMRLTGAGASAWAELRAGPIKSRPAAVLGRRLTDAGIAHPSPPPLVDRPDVTVVIPVRDRAEQLDRCLASFECAYPVIVVDDASSDARAVHSAASAHGAQVFRLDTHVGPAQARNIASAHVATELIAYVDSDTIPGHRWIADLAAHFADPAVAVVAPRIVPLADQSSSGRYTRARCNLDLGPQPARVVPYGPVSYVPTAAMLVRRAAVLEVGCPSGVFDAAMPIGEDVDLIWRLHEAGWRIRYDPGHQVPHQEPRSWPALLRRRRGYGTSSAALAVRHPDAMAPLFLQPLPAASVAAVVARRPTAAALALAASALRLRSSLRQAGVPAADLGPGTVTHGAIQTCWHTWIGVSRYLVQFAPALLAAGLLHRHTRVAAAAAALTPPLYDWARAGAPLGPVRFTAGYLADEIAYGVGVLSGCARERTLIPLRPIVVRRSA